MQQTELCPMPARPADPPERRIHQTAPPSVRTEELVMSMMTEFRAFIAYNENIIKVLDDLGIE